MQDCASEVKKLITLAGERGAHAKQIDPGDIVVAEWVRFKCRYGCKGYGKHFGCPPYAPAPEETRRMVGEYTTALLIRFDGVPGHGTFGPDDIPDDFHPYFRDLILWVNGTVHSLEKTAFYDGFYKAFGFGGYPCIWCEHQHCVAEEAEGVVDESLRRKCRHMDMVRPEHGGRGNGRVCDGKKRRLGSRYDPVQKHGVREDRAFRCALGRACAHRMIRSMAGMHAVRRPVTAAPSCKTA